MPEIEFDAPFGDERKHVWITLPDGAGANIYQIYLDNFYQGRLTKQNGQWIHWEGNLTTDDIQILGEMIDEAGLTG